MKITVIGSGSCYGVPTVGGQWGDCDPAEPRNKRTAASIVIETEKTKILVDMSPDLREQSLRHDITNLNAILFTHGHADHILGNFHMPRLLQYYKGKDIPVYADLATQQEIQAAFGFQMKEGGHMNFSYGGDTHWENLEPLREFTIGDITVLPLLQDHGAFKSFGFRIGDFAYSTDFYDFPPETWVHLQGLKCWIVECNAKEKPESGSKSHMYLERTLNFIGKVKPKTAYLTHLNTSMDYEKTSKELPDHVHLAYDGLEIDL